MTKVLVLNGPNLGRLGTREPEVYGSATHANLVEHCQRQGALLNLDVEVRQTDAEQQLVDWIAEAASHNVSVIINAAAFTHYSYPVRDAIAAHGGLVIEVHISNPHAREEFRHNSVIAQSVTGTVAGFGFDSYSLALHAIALKLGK